MIVQRYDSQFIMSLPYCLFFGRPLASYLNFNFVLLYLLCLQCYHFDSIFSFFPWRQREEVCFLFFRFLPFHYGPAAFASSFYLVILASVSALLLLLHNPVSDAAKSINPFLKGVSLWLGLWRHVLELSAMTSRYSSHYLDTSFQDIFFSGNNDPIRVLAPSFLPLSQKLTDCF